MTDTPEHYRPDPELFEQTEELTHELSGEIHVLAEKLLDDLGDMANRNPLFRKAIRRNTGFEVDAITDEDDEVEDANNVFYNFYAQYDEDDEITYTLIKTERVEQQSLPGYITGGSAEQSDQTSAQGAVLDAPGSEVGDFAYVTKYTISTCEPVISVVLECTYYGEDGDPIRITSNEPVLELLSSVGEEPEAEMEDEELAARQLAVAVLTEVLEHDSAPVANVDEALAQAALIKNLEEDMAFAAEHQYLLAALELLGRIEESLRVQAGLPKKDKNSTSRAT